MRRRARAVAGTGDLLAATALLDAGLAARDGSSDRAWADLTAYRDALAARHSAAEAHLAPITPEGRQRPGSQLTRR